MGDTVRVLSIDGGGIRGIMPAVILADIEARAKQPAAELFDLIAGTSTGGIIALALTKPGADGRPHYSAKDLVALYEEEGERIFKRSRWQKLLPLDNVLEERYRSEGIEKVLAEYFGDTKISEAVTPMFVTAYEIERRTPFFFKSHKAKTDDARDYLMADAARATSAAPTYFEPARLEARDSSDYFSLIDGGVYANNPAMCAYAEARSLFPDADDFLVVSLGTGELTRRIPHDEAVRWGIAHWAQPLLQVVFDGVSDTVDYQLRLLCRTNEYKRYYRFQVILADGNDDMDDASRTNVRVLKLLAEQVLRDRAEDIETLCAELVPAPVTL